MLDKKAIEIRWQKVWEKMQVFVAQKDEQKKKCYVLEMFPYPSGNLHVGHVRNYVIGDVIARYKMLLGFTVLHPIGWDAFGLPAENAAIEKGISPHDWTKSNIEAMKKELLSLGLSYDWNRELATCDSSYYVHEQRFFLKMLEIGFAYRKESMVNWDPIDNTVLANEQVVDGRGWRSGAFVERKMLSQWFLKITHYAEDLLQDLDGWPSNVKLMQKNWIGKALGVNIKFFVPALNETILVFSTRPETIFGCTFVAVSPHHSIVNSLTKNEKIKEFIHLCEHVAIQSANKEREKLGMHTGFYAEHPLNPNIQIPIFVANFVLEDYATGAIFGCPAHDARDYEFAQKYCLPIIRVVASENGNESLPYLEDGFMINSEFLEGLSIIDAKKKIIQHLIDVNKGTESVYYKLKDWGISRQRFWGCPIPIIHCPHCGILPVPNDQLPVTLPTDITITGKGNPLELHSTWKNIICHKCGSLAQRETDTFDTFFESSWYFLRFCSPTSKDLVDKEAAAYWMPVDHYIGGIEHAILHLMYARFLTKVICELGYCDTLEPFTRLLNQGMVLHHTFKDQNGSYAFPSEIEEIDGELYRKGSGVGIVKSTRLEKMSKSKKNVVSLKNMVEDYGSDAVRLFVMSDTPPEKDLEWSATGIEGCSKFIDRLFVMAEYFAQMNITQSENTASSLTAFTHRTIAFVSEALNNARFNKAIALLRELYNQINEKIVRDLEICDALFAFQSLIKMLNPFIPHVTEEIWHRLGEKNILATSIWPQVDVNFTKDLSYTIAVQINGKLRATMQIFSDLSEEEVKLQALNHEKVMPYIKDSVLKKIIYIAGKVINLIV